MQAAPVEKGRRCGYKGAASMGRRSCGQISSDMGTGSRLKKVVARAPTEEGKGKRKNQNIHWRGLLKSPVFFARRGPAGWC